MRKSRRWLTALLAAGLVGLGASSGTFATFNATTTNPGNTFATGSLTLSNTANAGTACFSFNGTSNANSNCSSVLTLDNTANYPGGPIALGAVSVANEGTINASRLDLYADGACVDSSATTFTNAVVSTSGTITAASGTNFDGVSVGMTVTATATATLGANTTVTSVTRDSSNDITSVNVSPAPTGGGTATVYFTLGSLSTSPSLCTNADVFVEEYGQSVTSAGSTTTTPYTKCWYGSCPTIGQLSSAVTGGTNPVSVGLVSAMVVNTGDSLAFVEPNGTNVVGTAATGSTGTSLSVDFPSTPSLAKDSAVIDLSTQPTSGSSLASFTSTTSPSASPTAMTSGGTSLFPLTASNTEGTSTATELAATASRSFLVGVYLPSGTNSNSAQDAKATFGLTWQISQ